MLDISYDMSSLHLQKPYLFITANTKGGTGKSTTAALFIHLLEHAGWEPIVLRADPDCTLDALLKKETAFIDLTSWPQLRRALSDALINATQTGQPIVMDLPAPCSPELYATQFSKACINENFHTVALLPVTAEYGSISGATEAVRQIQPAETIVFFRNPPAEGKVQEVAGSAELIHKALATVQIPELWPNFIRDWIAMDDPISKVREDAKEHFAKLAFKNWKIVLKYAEDAGLLAYLTNLGPKSPPQESATAKIKTVSATPKKRLNERAITILRLLQEAPTMGTRSLQRALSRLDGTDPDANEHTGDKYRRTLDRWLARNHISPGVPVKERAIRIDRALAFFADRFHRQGNYCAPPPPQHKDEQDIKKDISIPQ